MLDTVQILTLMNIPGIGRTTVKAILDDLEEKPSSVDEIVEVMRKMKSKLPRITVPNKTDLENSHSKALTVIEKAEKLGIHVFGYTDSAFPVILRYIPDPPVVLYVKGNVECLKQNKAVAVVGTRNPSQYGAVAGYRFGKVFAEKGLVVVSGLALGCDTQAHRGCLEADGYTVAVLAHGLDSVYPSANKKLAEVILEKNGCLVSEYPPNTRPHRNRFVERDRLQAGLSAGVVVVETDIKGGTMHTVDFCLKQNKPLGVLNHPPKYAGVDKARGNQKLIAEGKATPLFTPESIDFFVGQLTTTSNLSVNMQNNENKEKNGWSQQLRLDL